MIFGNSGAVSGIPPSQAEVQLSRLMQRAWAAFADDPKQGLSRFGWPKYDPQGETLVRLGYENSATPTFVAPSLYDAQCPSETLGVNG